jgi:hypothetical protein
MKDNHEDLKNQMYNLGVQLRTLSYETQKLDAILEFLPVNYKSPSLYLWHFLQVN